MSLHGSNQRHNCPGMHSAIQGHRCTWALAIVTRFIASFAREIFTKIFQQQLATTIHFIDAKRNTFQQIFKTDLYVTFACRASVATRPFLASLDNHALQFALVLVAVKHDAFCGSAVAPSSARFLNEKKKEEGGKETKQNKTKQYKNMDEPSQLFKR